MTVYLMTFLDEVMRTVFVFMSIRSDSVICASKAFVPLLLITAGRDALSVEEEEAFAQRIINAIKRTAAAVYEATETAHFERSVFFGSDFLIALSEITTRVVWIRIGNMIEEIVTFPQKPVFIVFARFS